MPALVVSNLGESHLLKRALRGPLAPTNIWHLRVFVNNYTPVANVTLADLVEATWSGYAPVLIDFTRWTDPLNPAGVATSFYGAGPTLFTPTAGAHPNYGYYLTFNNGADLLWVQRLDGAPISADPAIPLQIWPPLQLHSEYEP